MLRKKIKKRNTLIHYIIFSILCFIRISFILTFLLFIFQLYIITLLRLWRVTKYKYKMYLFFHVSYMHEPIAVH